MTSRPRIGCLRVPDLPLAAELRAHPELRGLPVAVAEGSGPRAALVSISPEAAQRGVRAGASVAHARAVCAELRVRGASPALESTARAALLDVALGFTPRAALAPRCSGAYASEAAVHLDASGTRALFRSEPGFAAALADRSAALGLPADVTLASSRGVSLIAARALRAGDAGSAPGLVRVLPPGSEAAFLAPLPLDLLAPPGALAESLTRFGVRTVRELLALPRRGLAQRLGPRTRALVALARGEEVEPPLSAPAPGSFLEAIDLEFSVERLEPLGFVLRGLLSRLLERLATRQLACAELRLELALEGGGRDARRLGLAAPSRDLRTLMRRVTRALEERPPPAPVLGAGIETEGAPLELDQLDLFRPAGPAPSALSRTLLELEALCGADRVGAPRVADDHHPDAYGLAPFAAATASPPRSAPDPDPTSQTPAPRAALRALRPPLRAQVELRGGRPARIRSALANGRVLALAGPWRTSGGWWSAEGRFAYESFDVQTSDGTVARLRLDRIRGGWEIDAVYD